MKSELGPFGGSGTPSGRGPGGPSRGFDRARRRALGWTVAGCALLGGLLALLPPEKQADEKAEVRPAPGAPARARTAVTAGAPASLSDLAALIAAQEARVRDRPRDGGAWAVLGTAYVERGRRTGDAGDYPRAERALRTSLRVRPDGNTGAPAGMAALAVARNDFRAAKHWGEEAVRVAPHQWTAYPALIDAHDGIGDHRAARAAAERLRGLGSAPPVRARLAGVYEDRGRPEDAAAAVSDAIARAGTPAERAAYLVRAGDLAWRRGEPRASYDYGAAALRADPFTPEALAVRARAHAALGRPDEAVRDYRAALEKRPVPQYALELGELYESLGREREAREQYGAARDAVRREEESGVNGALLLGALEADHGDAERAVRLLREEYARHPGLRAADALGWALHRAGRDDEALTFAVRATDRSHGGELRSAPYAYHRGEIERALGMTGEARRRLAEALRINPDFSPLYGPEARRALKELGEPSLAAPAVESTNGKSAAGESTTGASPSASSSPSSSPSPSAEAGMSPVEGAPTGSAAPEHPRPEPPVGVPARPKPPAPVPPRGPSAEPAHPEPPVFSPRPGTAGGGAPPSPRNEPPRPGLSDERPTGNWEPPVPAGRAGDGGAEGPAGWVR